MGRPSKYPEEFRRAELRMDREILRKAAALEDRSELEIAAEVLEDHQARHVALATRWVVGTPQPQQPQQPPGM